MGSVIYLVRDDGVTAATNTYDPYGVFLSADDAGSGDPFYARNPLMMLRGVPSLRIKAVLVLLLAIALGTAFGVVQAVTIRSSLLVRDFIGGTIVGVGGAALTMYIGRESP